MAEQEQLPLDELIAGVNSQRALNPQPNLAELISAWYRAALARAARTVQSPRGRSWRESPPQPRRS